MEDQKVFARELAHLAHELAPEHDMVTYGKPSEGLTPWDIYDEAKAAEAIKKARRANEIIRLILQER